MNNSMTTFAYRLNIQPMFFGIAQMMVILLCLIPTIAAMITRCKRNNPLSYGFINSIFRFRFVKITPIISFGIFFYFINVFLFVFFYTFANDFFTPLCFSINSSMDSIFLLFNFFSAIICIALFTRSLMSVCSVFVFIKFGKWFDLLASGTSFCYDSVRHFRTFLRDCLKPLSGYNPHVACLLYKT